MKITIEVEDLNNPITLKISKDANDKIKIEECSKEKQVIYFEGWKLFNYTNDLNDIYRRKVRGRDDADFIIIDLTNTTDYLDKESPFILFTVPAYLEDEDISSYKIFLIGGASHCCCIKRGKTIDELMREAVRYENDNFLFASANKGWDVINFKGNCFYRKNISESSDYLIIDMRVSDEDPTPSFNLYMIPSKMTNDEIDNYGILLNRAPGVIFMRHGKTVEELMRLGPRII